MRRDSRWMFVLLPLIVALFAFGLAQLLRLRFETGDAYPPYSSLRSDPLGTRAFYQSLERLDRVAVERNHLPLEKRHDDAPTTLFLFGLDVTSMNYMMEQEVLDLETRVRAGERLVLTFLPVSQKPNLIRWLDKQEKEEFEKNEKERMEGEKNAAGTNETAKVESPVKEDPLAQQPPPAGEKSEEPAPAEQKRPATKHASKDTLDPSGESLSLKQRWGVGFDYSDLKATPDDKPVPETALKKDAPDEFDKVSWHSALYFKDLTSDWRVVYVRGELPVMIERKLGAGTMVLVSDSYFLSNEAMRNERHPPLLAWLAGPHPKIIFDETHLGVHEDQGVALLMRKYRLHGLFVGLFLLAGLFIWKNSFSFVPPHEDERQEEAQGFAAGRDDESGFVNLLRRNIPASAILKTCFDEWNKSFSHLRKLPASDVGRIQSEITQPPSKEHNPATSYNAITQILAERK